MDFNNVMHEQQLHDMKGIYAIRLFRQNEGEHGMMPRVLGRVFLSAPVDERRLADDRFKLIQLGQEGELSLNDVRRQTRHDCVPSNRRSR